MWDVKVRKITNILPIAGADSIELAIVADGWPCVVRKGQWKISQLCVYIPQDSLVPNNLLEALGLAGRLSGPLKNRVKAIKLKGQVSIGILAPVPDGAKEDDSVADQLGITKWEPDIPIDLRGKIVAKPQGYLKYDIENIHNENWLTLDEEIVLTEKCDGTNLQCGFADGKFQVCSRNLCLEKDDTNTYWQIAIKYDLENKLLKYFENPEGIWLHGEIYGPIQTLRYGLNSPELILFDIRRYDKNTGLSRWYDWEDFISMCWIMDVPRVPLLYRGPYSKEIVEKWSEGPEQISGKELHIREGCVIKPIKERLNYRGNRVIVKCVSKSFMLL